MKNFNPLIVGLSKLMHPYLSILCYDFVWIILTSQVKKSNSLSQLNDYNIQYL